MEVTALGRSIIFDGKELADLNPSASVEDVVKMHAAAKPALATATIEGPVVKDGKNVYTVAQRIGTKG